MRIYRKTIYTIPPGTTAEIRKALEAIPDTAYVEFDRDISATVYHEDLIV